MAQEFVNSDVESRTWTRLHRGDGRTLELAPGETTEGGVWHWYTPRDDDGNATGEAVFVPVPDDYADAYLKGAPPAAPRSRPPAPVAEPSADESPKE